MLSYSLNKCFRSAVLLAQLSLLLEINQFRWASSLRPKITNLLNKFKKTLTKNSAVSAEPEFVTMNDVANPEKGTEFFILWCRFIIIKKTAYLLKIYQDRMKEEGTNFMFSFRTLGITPKERDNLKLQGDNFYDRQSFSIYK